MEPLRAYGSPAVSLSYVPYAVRGSDVSCYRTPFTSPRLYCTATRKRTCQRAPGRTC
jgi:hypothetical protein